MAWVYRLIKSELSGESPSLSARRLCKTCILNGYFYKNEALESLKNSFGKRFAKYAFLLLGDCSKIVFQLDAVKFATELILRIQNNDQSSVCTCSSG